MTLDLKQSTAPTPGQPDKQPLVLPIAFGLVSADGSDQVVKTAPDEGLTPAESSRRLIEFTTAERRVVFEDVEPGTVPSLLRGFSAPVTLVTDATDADLLTLATHDPDPFNRWEAVQRMLTRVLLDRVEDRSTDSTRLRPALAAAIRAGADDPAFAAQVLALPSESDLAREIGRDVDPDAIFHAREAVRAAIGTMLGPELRAVYAGRDGILPYAPDAAGAGRRSFRNAALHLLAAADADAGGSLAERQFETADNMTDRFAAPRSPHVAPGESRDWALASFYEAFEGEPLVIDKWFGLQAAIPEPDTPRRVKDLMSHPAFSMSTPNRVYALIGGFASNATQFNRVDGVGYDLVADVVVALDRKNPQVAARMLNAFRSWRLVEPARRARARAALDRIAAQPSLSADVRDIVVRSCA